MSSFKTNFALILTLVFWASAFVGIRVGLNAYSPGSLALLRFLVASLCMVLFYFFLPNKKKISSVDRVQLLLLGIVGIGIYNISLNYGERTVSAAVASFVIGLMPVFTLVLSVFFLKERLAKRVWFGIGLSLVGLLLMMAGESAQTEMNQGVLMILISALMGAIYNVMQKRYLRHYHPIAVTAWIIWGGTLSLLIFLPQLSREIVTANAEATRAAIYMGICPAALAYVAWSYLLTHWPASKASIYLYTLPVLSTVMGMVYLKEQPSFLSLCGGVIALIGALWARRVQSINLSFRQKNAQLRAD